MLSPTDEIIDIGSDHGLLCAYAVTKGKAKHATAADISAESLNKARRLIGELSLEDKVSFFVSDGFLSIDIGSGKYSAVMAGMGGELIMSILESGGDKPKRAAQIAMQPMGGEKELREYLYKSGYNISDESVVEEGGRFYQIILARYDGVSRPLPEGGLLNYGEKAYEKREIALKKKLERACNTLSKKVDAAKRGGAEPEELIKELREAEKLRAEW